MANCGPIVVRLETAGEPRKIERIGISNSSTVSPQSKDTAIPIPLGAGICSVTLPVLLDCNVSFKAGSPYQACMTPECKEVSKQQHISDTLVGYADQEPTLAPIYSILSTERA